jgi:hypothetical protein
MQFRIRNPAGGMSSYDLLGIFLLSLSPLLRIQCCRSVLTDSGSEFRLPKPTKSPSQIERNLSIFYLFVAMFWKFLGNLKQVLRIRIRIKLKGKVRIHIKVISWIRIRIHIEVISCIRIRINLPMTVQNVLI